MGSAIIRPTFDIRNREHKRAFAEEARKVLPGLMEINDGFLHDLFDEENPSSYQEIYQHWKQQWDHLCDWLIRTQRAVHCTINVALFENLYKPRL